MDSSQLNLNSGFHTADSGFQVQPISDSLLVELGFRIQIIKGIPDSLSYFTDSKAKPRIPDFRKQTFPGFRNPQAKIFRKRSGIRIPLLRAISCCFST